MVAIMNKEHKPTYFSPAIQFLGGKETVILRFCDISDVSDVSDVNDVNDVNEWMRFDAELFRVAITKSSAQTLLSALNDYLVESDKNDS